MKVFIKGIRIQNFRSIENIDVCMGMINILIGQNNAGKSNFLKAIDIAFNGSKNLSEEDIFVREGEHISKEKQAIIDIKIVPTNGALMFDDFWTGVFTEKWITIDEMNGSYVGIRTIIQYEVKKNDYVIIRKPITEWNDSVENARVGRNQLFTSDMYDFINHYYMDAQRDIISDLRDRKSYFGRATSATNLSEEQICVLEEKLNEVNQEVVGSISAITETNLELSKIGSTLGQNNSKVQIEPLSRRIGDLHKGMDITFKEGAAASFSVLQHGMGTRSWISFLTLGAYVEYVHKSIIENEEDADDLVVLSLEEPEAHLHPQAQRQIYQQLVGFNGQKIVSTHSSSILAQAKLDDLIHFKKNDGKTHVSRFDVSQYSDEELAKIRREVVNSHGELIFASAIILCEGITEEQALPVYFKEFFGREPIFLGINIIGIGGQNYKTYLKFIREFELPWYIFSDGEDATIHTVKKAVKVIADIDIEELKNVVIIGNGYDYEKMVIKNGNNDLIIDAINSVNGNDQYYNQHKSKFGEIKTKRVKTNKPKCQLCGQDIYEDVIEDETVGLTEEEKCLYKCMTSSDGKAKYAIPVAQSLITDSDYAKRIPKEVLKLFIQMEKDFGLERRSDYNGLNVI